MMMERAKTAPAPEETASAEKKNTSTTSTSTAPSSAEERVQDLERRLNDLGGGGVSDSSAANVSTTATNKPSSASAKAAPQTGKNNPLLVSSKARYTNIILELPSNHYCICIVMANQYNPTPTSNHIYLFHLHISSIYMGDLCIIYTYTLL